VNPVLRVKLAAPNALRLQSIPGLLPVSLAVGPEARTIAVYDVQGRRVNRWQVTPRSAGRVSWDGRGSSGRAVGSGVYWIRVEDGAPGPALKVLIAR